MDCMFYRLYEANDEILDNIKSIIKDTSMTNNIKLLLTGVCDNLAIYENSNIVLYNGYYFQLTKEEICNLLDLAKEILEEDLYYDEYTSYNEFLMYLSTAYERRQCIDLNE